ncbi:MAG: methyltransferase domain-containing protein [Silicimonas sp.]|nr:methyltransferase domain-containing protein [Silicimonas sp.]
MYDGFRDTERDGWGARAGQYRNYTARVTTQAIPALLAAVQLRAGDAFLDVCAGPGYAAGAAQALCATATGIDFSPEMVRIAADSFPDCRFQQGDALGLDFPDNSFDAAVCAFGLLHTTDPVRAINEAYRVLRPGGRYGFSQWCAPAESDFFRFLMAPIARHADMSVADAAPDAFALSDRHQAEQVMAAAGFSQVVIREVPSVYHAAGGDMFDNIMALTVRAATIVQAQSDAVQQAIRDDVNAAALPYETGQGMIVPMPSFVVSGVKG